MVYFIFRHRILGLGTKPFWLTSVVICACATSYFPTCIPCLRRRTPADQLWLDHSCSSMSAWSLNTSTFHLCFCFYRNFVMNTFCFPVCRFSTDPHTWDIDQQFLLGSSLLISPVLQAVKNSHTIDLYYFSHFCAMSY